jgi:hypothetical protein
VEKPPAPDLEGLHSLIELARQAQVTCCVGMNFRWAEGVRQLVRALEFGRYGTVRCVRVEHVARKPVESFGPHMSLEASLFAAQGIHAIDLAQMLLPGTSSPAGQMIAVERGRLCSMVSATLRPELGWKCSSAAALPASTTPCTSPRPVATCSTCATCPNCSSAPAAATRMSRSIRAPACCGAAPPPPADTPTPGTGPSWPPWFRIALNFEKPDLDRALDIIGEEYERA